MRKLKLLELFLYGHTMNRKILGEIADLILFVLGAIIINKITRLLLLASSQTDYCYSIGKY